MYSLYRLHDTYILMSVRPSIIEVVTRQQLLNYRIRDVNLKKYIAIKNYLK